jgi:F-type H+-transporting ATPase subunit b
MKEFLHNPMNVYTFAFIVFWALIYFLARKPILNWLDGEIRKITAELNVAHELRAEAEAVLADCKAKQAKAEREAQVIVSMAKQQAEAMRKEADAELESTLVRQQQLTTERIQLAQEKAISVVRDAAVTMGMELARRALTENLSQDDAAKLVEQAINEIPTLNVKKY